jgi:hypothetical protein
MFGSFPSMRDRGAEVLSKIASAMMALSGFPAWAIVRACASIRSIGYEVTTGHGPYTERHWPPSHPELEMIAGRQPYDPFMGMRVPAVLLLYRRDRDVPPWTGLRTAGCHLAGFTVRHRERNLASPQRSDGATRRGLDVFQLDDIATGAGRAFLLYHELRLATRLRRRLLRQQVDRSPDWGAAGGRL